MRSIRARFAFREICVCSELNKDGAFNRFADVSSIEVFACRVVRGDCSMIRKLCLRIVVEQTVLLLESSNCVRFSRSIHKRARCFVNAESSHAGSQLRDRVVLLKILAASGELVHHAIY
jgi:hypothetical protein